MPLCLSCSRSSQAWPAERVGQRPLPEMEQQQRQRAAEQRGIDADSRADGRNRTTAPRRPRPWRRRRRPSPSQSSQRPRPGRRRRRRDASGNRACPCRRTARAARKPATSASEIRFEIVMVKRSLAAANAIRAGNSMRRAISRIMKFSSAPVRPTASMVQSIRRGPYRREMNNRKTKPGAFRLVGTKGQGTRSLA